MRKNSLYIISSLFFACVLFIYATSTNFQNSNTARQVKSETYTNTIANVPIDIHYDNSQYFISGFASEVSVVLTGANRVTLASEMQESTRKFKVTADLTDASVGTIEVPLNIENLPSGLTAVAIISCFFWYWCMLQPPTAIPITAKILNKIIMLFLGFFMVPPLT